MKNLVVLFVFILAGCATVETNIMPNANFRNYKQAYIEQLRTDEFNMYSAISYELNDMGIKVVGIPFREPTDTDMLVRYNYIDGWDLTRYLKSFSVNYYNAKDGGIIASSHYSMVGIWNGTRNNRLESSFNDMRRKLGLPDTNQFSR